MAGNSLVMIKSAFMTFGKYSTEIVRIPPTETPMSTENQIDKM